MIPDLLLAVLLALVPTAMASDAPAPTEEVSQEVSEEAVGEDPVHVPDVDALTPWRTRFDVLAERAIGTTSRPVEFNWRRTKVQIGATGSYLAELNNFNSMRAGALLRLPSGGSLVEIGVTRVETWNSPASRALAYTPYRQPARPSRFELDVAVGIPLAEGVVTAVPRFFPAVQMVFNVYGGLRYRAYPQGFGQMKPGQLGAALISPSLTEHELDNLEDARLASMQVDPERFGLVAGFGNDLYFKSGFFVSPRVMVGVPLLAPATGTELWLWADLSLAVGLAL